MNALLIVRMTKGHTLSDAAKESGVSESVHSNFEGAKVLPAARSWPKLARYYGLSVPELFVAWQKIKDGSKP